jgi:hypothetical protein
MHERNKKIERGRICEQNVRGAWMCVRTVRPSLDEKAREKVAAHCNDGIHSRSNDTLLEQPSLR